MTDYFDGLIALNWPAEVIAIIFVLHFTHSYRVNCIKEGYKIDFWHFQTAYFYIFTVFILYPFSGSYVNVLATGENIISIRDNMDRAFYTTSLGYIGHYFGFYIYKI